MFTRLFFTSTFENRKSFNFDGIDDHLAWDSLNNDIALDTTGAISIWIKIPADDNTQRTFFSISNNASGVLTELSFIVDFREAAGGFPGNSFTFLAIGNNVDKWFADAGANFLTPHIGNWIHVVITHDSSTPTLYVNGSLVTLNFQVNTDKTFWFKSTLTDTTPASNVSTVGGLRRNGAIITPYNENIDEVAIYNGPLNASEVNEIYNSGTPNNLKKISSSGKLVSWLKMGDDPLDDATGGTGVIKDQLALNDAIPANTVGNNIELDVP